MVATAAARHWIVHKSATPPSIAEKTVEELLRETFYNKNIQISVFCRSVLVSSVESTIVHQLV